MFFKSLLAKSFAFLQPSPPNPSILMPNVGCRIGPQMAIFPQKESKRERGCLNLILNGLSSASCTSKEVTELSNHSAYVWEWGLLWQCEAFICLQKMINIQWFKYSQSLLKLCKFWFCPNLWNQYFLIFVE